MHLKLTDTSRVCQGKWYDCHELGFAAVSWAPVPTPDGTVRGLPGLTHVDVGRTQTGLLQKQKSKPLAQVLQEEGGLGDGGTHRACVQEGARAAERGLVGVVLTQRREEAGKQTVRAWGLKSG